MTRRTLILVAVIVALIVLSGLALLLISAE
jgi:hypothetical protein